MPTFQSNTFRPTTSTSSSLTDRFGARYRASLAKHPFLLFGLPFLAIMVAGSFFLTPATALRYERHDRKVRQLSQDEAMSLGLKGKGEEGEGGIKRNPRRRVVGSEKDEYYVCDSLAGLWGVLRRRKTDRTLLEIDGQRPGQLGAETSSEVQGRTGWEAVVSLGNFPGVYIIMTL